MDLSPSSFVFGRSQIPELVHLPRIACELGAGLRGAADRGAGLIQKAARERDQAVDIGEVAGQADRSIRLPSHSAQDR